MFPLDTKEPDLGELKLLASELGISALPLKADMLSVSIDVVKCQQRKWLRAHEPERDGPATLSGHNVTSV